MLHFQIIHYQNVKEAASNIGFKITSMAFLAKSILCYLLKMRYLSHGLYHETSLKCRVSSLLVTKDVANATEIFMSAFICCKLKEEELANDYDLPQVPYI